MLNSPKTTIQFKYLFVILTLFLATWLTSNIAAIKLVNIFGLTLTGGFFIFPLTTMLAGLIVEVYGYKNARQAIWCGFIMNLSFIFLINLVNSVPSSPYWKLEEQFQNILIPETRIILASLFSFLLSDFANSYIMAKMKTSAQGASLFKRIFTSNCCAFLIDIICFMLLAFWGALSPNLLFKLMLTAYVKKFVFQLLLFPALWYLIHFIKKSEGLEIYDYETRFNPFSLDNIYDKKAIRKLAIKDNVIDYQSKILKNAT